jgi:hypothetical protein
LLVSLALADRFFKASQSARDEIAKDMAVAETLKARVEGAR